MADAANRGAGKNVAGARRAAPVIRDTLEILEGLRADLARVARGDESRIERDEETRPASDTGEEYRGVYVISVAARLLAMHPQTLRKYDRAGLVRPQRSGGMLRLYSDEDLERLRIIRRLVDGLGMNLAGAGLVMEIVRHVRGVVDALESDGELAGSRTVRAAAAELRDLLAYVGAE